MSESGMCPVAVRGAFTVISPRGPIGPPGTDALLETLDSLFEKSRANIAIDLRDAPLVGSQALSVMLRANEETKKLGGRLVLGNLSPDVKGLVKMARLDELLEIIDDLDEFLAESAKSRDALQDKLRRALDLPDGE
jgi:anti-anti-sigma factor